MRENAGVRIPSFYRRSYGLKSRFEGEADTFALISARSVCFCRSPTPVSGRPLALKPRRHPHALLAGAALLGFKQPVHGFDGYF